MKNWELKAATLFVASVLFVLLFSAVPSMAQATTGTLAGNVTDAKGAVVANATVKVKNEGTGVEITTSTNGEGIFLVPSLIPGAYTITTSAGGFKKSVKTGVQIRVGITNPADISLEVGSVGETVTVTAGSDEVLQTEQSQISSSLSTRQVQDLPSNGAGGGIDTLALLIPGVVANRVGGTNTNGTGLSVNGNRGRSNNFQIDGSDNNDLSVGGPALFVDFQDAVQEFQVITNNFSAQYGRNQGAVVNIVTKSGTNDFHGSAFVHHQDATTFNSLNNIEARGGATINPNLYTVYGGTVGGPIFLPTIGDNGPAVTRLRDKAFFFFAYQAVRNPSTFTSRSTNLGILADQFPILQAAFPGNAVINTMATFSPWVIPGANLNLTTSSQTPFFPTAFNLAPSPGCPRAIQNGTAPPAGCLGAYTAFINPATGQPFLTGGPYDVVNFGTAAAPRLVQAANYERTRSTAYIEDYYNIRIDARPTSRDSINWRFQKQSSANTNAIGSIASGFSGDIPAGSKNSGGAWTHTFSNSLFNDLRVSYQRIGVEFGGGSLCPTLTTPGCIPGPANLGQAFANIAFTAALGITKTTSTLPTIGPATNLPQGRIGKVSQIADNLTKIWGRHSVTFGAEYKYLDTLVPFLPNFNGAYTYSSSITGLPALSSPASRITNNAPSAVSIAVGNPTIDFLERDQYFFVQDDFKFRPNLTLNLGIRYEFTGQPLNQINVNTVARESGGVPLFNPALPLAARTVPRIPSDKNNFAPRLGFAYTPHFWKKLFGEDQTVFRGGFSIAYDASFYNILLNVNTAAPAAASLVIPSGSLPATAGGPAALPPNPFGNIVRAAAAASGVLPLGVLNPAFLTVTRNAPDFHTPYSEQFSFGMQRQFGRKHLVSVGYVGTHGVSLFQNINDNFFIGPLFDGFTSTRSGVSVTYLPFRNQLPANATRVFCVDVPGTLDNEGACNNRQFNAAGITTRNNSAQSIYHSLQTHYSGRFFKDSLAIGVSYTWSKTIDNASEIFNFSSTGSPNAQNPFCLNSCERALSNLDRPHAFSMNWVYDVPFYKDQRGVVGHLLGGWQLNGTYIVTSGSLFTPDNGVAGSLGLGNTYLTAGDRPFNGNVNAPNTSVGISQLDAFFAFGIPCNPAPCTIANTGFWSVNALNAAVPSSVAVTPNDVRWIINGPGSATIFGTPFGNVPRSAFRGPIYNNMNLSVFKNIKMRERFSLQLRAEAFNALNHPNPGFGVERGGFLPGTSLASAGVPGGAFGNFQDITYARRVIQFGIRLVF